MIKTATVAFTSCKGGAGKTTLAVNTAAALTLNVLLIDLGGGAARFFQAPLINLEEVIPEIDAYRDPRLKNLFVLPIYIDPASIWRIKDWDNTFSKITEAVRRNIVKYSIDVVIIDMYQLSRITPLEVFGLDKSDIIVLVVEGYEDCSKSLTLIKKFFDAKLLIVLNKHEKGIEYPGATLKIPFSATLDYYNRKGQFYTKPVVKFAEYLAQELKKVPKSKWFIE
ncbi:MAG: ParA family protein [Pyrobaculum sp.]